MTTWSHHVSRLTSRSGFISIPCAASAGPELPHHGGASERKPPYCPAQPRFSHGPLQHRSARHCLSHNTQHKPPHNERGCRSQANRDKGRGDLWTLCSFRERSRLLIPGTSRHTKKSVAANLARTACSRPSAGLLEPLAGSRWVMLAIAICAFRSGRARSSDVLARTAKRGVHCHVFEYLKKRLSGGLWRAAYRCVGRTTLNHHQQE
jgi:hypothetical protein